MKFNQLSIALILFYFFFLIGCSNNYLDHIDRGAGFEYVSGSPELRIASSGFFDEKNNPTILISGDIVYGSLIYKKNKDQNRLEAIVNVEVSLKEASNSSDIDRIQFTDTLYKKNNSVIHDQDVYRFERQFIVNPGIYKIEVSVTDVASGKTITRESSTEIPDPVKNRLFITEIRTLGKTSSKRGSEFHQVTTYDIPSHLDSLKFVFQVSSTANKKNPIDIEARLIRFKADTSAAWPMSHQNYPQSSLPYIGIDYDDYKEIHSSKRTLSEKGNILIEYNYNKLPEGNYRLEVKGNKNRYNQVFRGRDFGVKSPYYPSLKKPRDLAEPLYYIMGSNEYKKLMAMEDPDSLKQAIDKFWLSNINNSQIARDIISLYYTRVEEANKQFSNFKEGWKTDPGMMYILFGPPWKTNLFYIDLMLWSYSHNLQDPEKNFKFKQTKQKNKFYPFSNYVLERSVYYHSLEYQQKEKWLSGSILLND